MYTIKGKGQLNLTKRDFLASGGEGSVYVKGQTAYKIYTDIKKTIPEGKIQELSKLTLSNIIHPIDIIVNDAGQNCGYSMKYVKKDEVFTLCELFPKAFKDRNKLRISEIIKLVKKFQETISHCHLNKILLVDINEMNFLVPKDYSDIYFIDTDSYQTPSYNATAIMDSIRDRHCKQNQFTEGTDWFSFGIVTFNLFTGIHPYKGKHDIYKTLDDRMIHNLSVLNSNVSYPKIIGDIKTILPQNYLDWYEVVFEKGLRIAPPTGNVNIATIARQVHIMKGSDHFIITDCFESPDNLNALVDFIDPNNILTTGGYYLQGKLDKKVAPYSIIVKTPKMNHAISFIISKNNLMVYDITSGKILNELLYASEIMKCKNKLYVKQQDKICEIVFLEGSDIHVTLRQVANIIEISTQMFEGCAIQNLLGSYYLSMFDDGFQHFQIYLKELTEHRIITAKYDNHVCMILSECKSIYYKMIFKISTDYSSYIVFDTVKDVNDTEISFVTLDNGVVILRNDDGYVSIFHNSINNQQIKIIQDTIFNGNTLFKINNNVYFAESHYVKSVKMK